MTNIYPLAIVVLAGGISHERDISLRSGRRVADALTGLGHKVTLLDPQAGLLLDLSTRAPDVIFPVVHGATGEDGALLALLETFAGTGSLAPVGTPGRFNPLPTDIS